MASDAPAIEQLLHVITATERLEWSVWKNACASVSAGASLSGMSPADCARILEQLGHAEIGPAGATFVISAAPAVLARLPRAGLPVAVLCGGRSPQTESRLRAAAAVHGTVLAVEAAAAPRLPAPRIFIITADDSDALARTASEAGVRYSPTPPAWALAATAGSLVEYVGALEWQYGPEPAIVAREFDPATGCFGAHAPGRQGMRLIRYFPRTFVPYCELRDGDRAARVDRDWGAWACLAHAGLTRAVYDRTQRAVAFPARLPLPRPLGRALGLCSGRPPVLLERGPDNLPAPNRVPLHVFTDVPSNLTSAVLDCLAQDPLPFQLRLPDQA